MEETKAHSSSVRLFYFWTGIVATFTYRAIIILNNYSALWVKVFWYIGTVGFVIYFAHRYQISEKRARLIKESGLVEKINGLPELNQTDREAMKYIFGTLTTSKEKWNYIAIFVLSGLSLIIGLYLDIF
ncbi:MAG: hypothetical protein COY66_02905 [Candidatus Kerfeldbacteria bacterium CG_4_10_14_0_8_um_filter_42_10]|uniref:DUF3899 domain-containing protein n=1 Tax=Candidatus Kerfeldbacteria bacterium CG_4_10_14_0_8_um_filter_42_10 TaxID=2014248 RepID=A0A2M7RJ37_9BACT|nr:MAG: hypothetical protein COY66_02905 [Candidatus Kerfeldbacteria bacterium CG_4_10_14_0_8_um_filter_42_10]